MAVMRLVVRTNRVGQESLFALQNARSDSSVSTYGACAPKRQIIDRPRKSPSVIDREGTLAARVLSAEFLDAQPRAEPFSGLIPAVTTGT